MAQKNAKKIPNGKKCLKKPKKYIMHNSGASQFYTIDTGYR